LKSKNKETQPSQQKIKAKKVQRNILAETAMDQLLIYTQKKSISFYGQYSPFQRIFHELSEVY